MSKSWRRGLDHNEVPRRVRRGGYRVFLGGIQSGIQQISIGMQKREGILIASLQNASLEEPPHDG